MKKRVLSGGVHPFERKELSADKPIKSIDSTQIMVYPLSQHIGASAVPVVSLGDRVLKGQLIADSNGFVSAPIHSAVSGTVKAIEKRLNLLGSMVDTIVIENDFKDEAVDTFNQERELESLSESEIVDIIAKAGIVGLGGAGFPTSVKISPKNIKEIDTVIINGSECEPYLTSDYRIMIEKGNEVFKGIASVLEIFKGARAVIAIEKNKPQAIELFNSITAGHKRFKVLPLKTKYPQGGERQLIYSATGRRINSKMLPADARCVVLNVSTCYAIYEAVYKNIPLIHRIMTVTGEGINTPCNLDVPLGISHADVLKSAGGAKEGVVKFISGGPMMGSAMESLDVPVVKTSSSILAYLKDDVAKIEQSHCIHCGRCVKACPERLVPQMMAKYVRANDFSHFESIGGMECIGCGCCVYVCPAKIPLTQMFKLGKAKVLEERKKS